MRFFRHIEEHCGCSSRVNAQLFCVIRRLFTKGNGMPVSENESEALENINIVNQIAFHVVK